MKIEGLKTIKEEFSFDNELFAIKYSTECNNKTQKNKKTMFIFHDVGEHSGRYGDFVKSLICELDKKQMYIDCYCIDFPGHGRSGGKRGYIKNLKELSHDLLKYINTKSSKDDDVVLLGHGVGGLIVCDILHNEMSSFIPRFCGGLLLNPAFKLKKKPFHFLERVLQDSTLAESIKVTYGDQEATFENNNDELNDQDPLFCHKLSLSTIWQTQSLGKSLRTSSYYLEYPFFVGVNNSHPVYDEGLTELFCRGFENGQFKKYYHAPHYLKGGHIGTNALKDIIKWFQNEIF